MATGILTCGIVSMFPDHFPESALAVGLGLTLVLTALGLWPLARNARLEWRGVSPVLAIVLGALLGAGPEGWRHIASQYSSQERATTRVAPLPVVPASVRGYERTAPTMGQSVDETLPQADASPSVDSHLLDRLSDVLQNQAVPIVHTVLTTTAAMTRAPDPRGYRYELAAANDALRNVQLSLTKLRTAANGESRNQLNVITGDAAVVEQLRGDLQRLCQSLDGNQTGASAEVLQLARQSQVDATTVSHWITAGERRIADARIGTSSML